eukprot:CAMPEP_0172548940 /NCGR_PEP_ID=MMETSP1067-20121228/18128_1 /TAXON_ID=265564 ORGANISM="Thalassiosira punctigera, Strain Tpunct2005C2" /NCGR_SAMPLE_ID=MMETSP1067 /ASSEMBLY_ACC=CAM_ASM_000444 /LENGTH=464 /DNA_ID=CAMNT_0013336245 /DNA_START=17 /DNA_END=1411 /DNA_ORIENTATION=-
MTMMASSSDGGGVDRPIFRFDRLRRQVAGGGRLGGARRPMVASAATILAVVGSDGALAFRAASFRGVYHYYHGPRTTTSQRRQARTTVGPYQSRLHSIDGNDGGELLPAPLRSIRSPDAGRIGGEEAAPFRYRIQVETLGRILLPSLLSSVLAFFLFPPMSLGLSYLINDAATFAVLSVDSSQFIQNFLTVTGLTFSILVGQTYYFMYQQQEAVFVSLFGEVTEAKSLLEQVALVCQGRRDMYEMCLGAIKRYVEEDLKEGLGKEPAQVLSARPMDDPLEIIMYLTSVGIPSSIYDTVRSLRQARALRLGALQKKLPPVHLLLLWLLAIIELSSFPVLGAGTQTIGGYNILTIEGALFAIMTFGIVLTLNVVGELYTGSGGAYNVDSVLNVMVRGLDEELETRMRDVDRDLPSRAFLGTGEREEVERRQTSVLPSPVYYPMRYTTLDGGILGEEDSSVEANGGI